MLGYDYPILGVFWTMFLIFLWVAWIILLFRVLMDLFRTDMNGWGKALWAIGVIIFPFIGVFVYLIVHGKGMTERDIADARQSEAAVREYIRTTAGTASTADELSKLAELRASGTLTDAEYEQQKAKLLA